MFKSHLLVQIVRPCFPRNLKAGLAIPKRNGIWVLDCPRRRPRLDGWKGPHPGGCAQRASARRSATCERNGPLWNIRWTVGLRGLKDTSSCHLRGSVCSRTPPGGFSSFLFEVRRRGQCPTSSRSGFSPAPGQPRRRSRSRGAELQRTPWTGRLGTGLRVRQIPASGAPRARSQAERVSDSSRRGEASVPSRAAMPAGPSSCSLRRVP